MRRMKVMAAASRGRMYQDRLVQMLELGGAVANCVTTVSKDSLVVEIWER